MNNLKLLCIFLITSYAFTEEHLEPADSLIQINNFENPIDTSAKAIEVEAPIGFEADRKLYAITLNDNQTISGYIVSEDDKQVIIELKNGGRLNIDKNIIKKREITNNVSIVLKNPLWLRDPSRTSYLYSQSAFMLKRGEVSFSQKELIFSSLGVGISENLNLQVSSAIPLWFIENDEGNNFFIAAKTGWEIMENLHLAGGMQLGIFPEVDGPFTLPFGTVTVGDDEKHMTFNLSIPFGIEDEEYNFGEYYWFTFCGNIRLSKRFALISENWIFKMEENESPFIFALACRIMGKRFTTDIGVFTSYRMGPIFPWLDITYHW